MPERIRRAGFRAKLPLNTKLVSRPTRWSNPFRIGVEAQDHADAKAQFRAYVLARPELIARARKELTGYNLACYCPLEEPCHADVWLEILAR